MSQTWSYETIEAHMRQQTSKYLLEWLEHSAAIEKQLKQAGFDTTTDPPVDDIAITILKERGDWEEK